MKENGECLGDCEYCSDKRCAGRDTPELDWEKLRHEDAIKADREFRVHTLELIVALGVVNKFDGDAVIHKMVECEGNLPLSSEDAENYNTYFSDFTTTVHRICDYHKYFGADEIFNRYREQAVKLAVEFRSIYLYEMKGYDENFENRVQDFSDKVVEDMLRKFPEEHFIISEENKKLLSCLLEGYLSGEDD